MFEPAQILLFIIIIILTIFLVVLGIQVFLILKDLRQTIVKTNKILDDSAEISRAIKNPVMGLSNTLMGIKTGATFANMLRKVTDLDKEESPNGR